MKDITKLPPQASDIEEAVLGAILVESDSLLKIANILNVDSFYKQEHQIIFKAIRELNKANEVIDILTVKNQVQKQGELELVGGAFYITQLTSRVASSAHIVNHAKIVQQKYIARQVIAQANESLKLAYDDSVDAFDIVSDMNKANITINELVAGTSKDYSMPQATTIANNELIKRANNYRNGIINGIPSGINDLDKLTKNFRKGHLIVVAARPSMGKTAFALTMAKNIAKNGNHIKFFSLEMPVVELTDRLIISESDVDSEKYDLGNITDFDFEAIEMATAFIEKLPINIDDKAGKKILEICASCMIAKKKNELDAVIIDYLQLIQAESEKGKNREREVAEISTSCKNMAKDLEVPVILLAQLNRDVEKRGDKRPQLSDLRESGAIEQDADMVIFLYRDTQYGIFEDGEGNSTEGILEMIISKHRGGRCGVAKAFHNPSMTVIKDLAEQSEPSMDLDAPVQINPNEYFETEGKAFNTK